MKSDVKSKLFSTSSSTSEFSDLSIKGRLFFKGLIASKKLNPAKTADNIDGELILKGVNDSQNDFGPEVTRIKFYIRERVQGGPDMFCQFFDKDGYLEFDNGISLAKSDTSGNLFAVMQFVIFYIGGQEP